MKKLIVFLFLALPAIAQTYPNQGFITSTQCVSVPATNQSSGGYAVSGTWTGTLTAYGVVGQGVPSSIGSATANGSYVVTLSGFTLFEVCGNSVSSGAAYVQLSASSGSGSSSGSISSGTIGGTLPAASSVAAGTLYQVTNGNSPGDCIVGSGSSLALCRSNGTTWQAIGDGGGGNVPGGTLVVTAIANGVKANTKFVFDAALSNSASVVTCPNNDCNFSAGDVGKIVFVTSLGNTGFNLFNTSTLLLPQGTITSLNSANSINVSTTSTGSCTSASNACLLVWGSDDTTALQNTWTQVKSTAPWCGMILLPAGRMLTQQPQFNGDASPSCLNGVGGSRVGFGIHGYDISSTMLMPTPNFAYSNCTGGTGSLACFFGVVDGVNISDLTVFGSGLNNAGASTYTGMYFAGNNNSFVHDVSCIGWGTTNANGLLIGMLFQAGTSEYERVENDGCGKYGVKVTGGGAAPSASFVHLVSQDTGAPLWVTATTYTTESIIESTIDQACLIGINNGATLYSVNDNIGEHLSGGNGVCVGAEPYAQGSTGGGFLFMTGSNVDVLANSGDGAIIVLGNSGNFADITGNRFAGSGSTHGVIDPFATGTYIIDGGGNKFLMTGTSLGYASSSGTWINFASATKAQVSTNWTLSAGWGTTATVSGCQGNAIVQTCTVTSNGTGQAANPTIAIVAPLDGPTTAYPYAPSCVATNVFGGTGALAAMQGTVAPTTTNSGTYQWTGTPVAASTYIVRVECN